MRNEGGMKSFSLPARRGLEAEASGRGSDSDKACASAGAMAIDTQVRFRQPPFEADGLPVRRRCRKRASCRRPLQPPNVDRLYRSSLPEWEAR
jgi:hypothetical protein